MRNKLHCSDSAELRHLAENRLGEKSGTLHFSGKMEEQQRLLHELQVHQIELEIQNAELQQARTELETALEMYSDLYDFAPVGYLTLDRNGTISTANLSGASLLGVERSRLNGQYFRMFVTEDCRHVFTAFLGTVFSSRGREVCEVELLNKGSLSLFVRIEAVAAASGLECRVVLIDISARKREEELLLRSESRYRTAVEDQADVIYRIKADGTFTFVNDVYCRLIGKTEDELLGGSWYPAVVPDDLPIIEEQLSRLSPSNPVVGMENRLNTASGDVCWMQSANRGFFDNEGRLVEIQCIGRDITKRKEVENAFRTSDERLSLALAASRMGVWEWDLQSNAVVWSPECHEIVGLKEFNGTFAAFADLLHPDDAAHAMATVDRVLAQRSTYADEFRIIRPDGEQRWLFNLGRTTYDINGIPLRLTGTVQDITERKQAEIELQEKNAELERFTYSVSHDLKSPLITIQSYAGLIQQDLEEGRHSRVQGDLKRIVDASAKMGLLLDDLLELSRVGRMMNPPSQFEMGRLVDDVLEQLSGPLKQKRVETTVQADLPAVHGDRRLIAQLLQNLVENAIKYMGDQETPRIGIGARQENSKHVFFVSDNGKGIEPDFRESIFGLFNKLDSKSEGNGIGLALVKRIIEVHGGRVWVESEGAGRGSTFCFALPTAIHKAEA